MHCAECGADRDEVRFCAEEMEVDPAIAFCCEVEDSRFEGLVKSDAN